MFSYELTILTMSMLSKSSPALTLSSGHIALLSSPRMMNDINGLSGIIVIANGINLLKV